MAKNKPAPAADATIPGGGDLPAQAPPRIPRRVPHELVDAMNSLPAGGQYFYRIRRRLPGGQLLSMFKRKLPIEEVDDIVQFCFAEGGTEEYPGNQCDFKIEIVDGTERRMAGPTEVQHEEEPRKKPGSDPKALANLDPTLAQAQEDLRRRKEEIRIRRERIAIERDERRLERQELDEEGEYDDFPAEGGGQFRMRPAGGAQLYDPITRSWVPNPYAQMGGQMRMPGMPNFNDPEVRRLEKENDDLKRRLERMEDKIAVPRENGVDTFLKLLPFFQQEGFKPKDMLSWVGPMITQMGQMSAETSKLTMQGMVDLDKESRRRMWDFVMATGDDDLIEKVSKWIKVGEDGMTRMLRVGLGRSTIKPGEKVQVPVLNKNPDPKPTTAPAPEKTEDGEPKPTAPKSKVDPVKVIIERVSTFLKVQEEEMLIEADPILIAGKLDELYLLFPTPLRTKIEASNVGDIYEELRKYDSERVDAILLACNPEKVEKPEDKERALRLVEWAEAFWEEVKNPEDEENDDDDPETEKDPEPQPASPGKKE